MTNNAAWSRTTVPANPGSYSFSSDRLTCSPLSGTPAGIVATTSGLASGRYVFAMQYNGGTTNLGVLDTGSIAVSPPATGLVYGSGTGQVYYSPSGASYGSVATLAAAAAGDWLVVAFDTGAGAGTSGTKQAWMCLVHGGVAGNWNGSGTANPDTNTGGLATPDITHFIPACWFFAPGGAEAVLNSLGPMPGGIALSTFSLLPSSSADSALAIDGVISVEGGNTFVSWHCYNFPTSGGLQWMLDDSAAWIGGTDNGYGQSVTGSSGTFQANISLSNPAFHFLSIRETTNTVDVTPDFRFQAQPPGAGVININVTLAGAPPSQTFLFVGNTNGDLNVNFGFDCLVQDSEFGSGTCGVQFKNVGGTPLLDLTPQINPDYMTGIFSAGPDGAEESISLSSTSLTSFFASGSCALSVVSGNVDGDYSFSCNGTTIAQTGVRFATGVTDPNFYSVTIGQTGTRGTNIYGLTASCPAIGEEIFIQSGSAVPGGTLALAGVTDNGPPMLVDISYDGGATFDTAGFYHTDSGTSDVAYNAATWQTLTAGTYVTQIRDTYSLQESNFFTVVVVPPEDIILSTGHGVAGSSLAMTGTSDNGPPAALDYSYDGGTTWLGTVTAYSTGGGTTAAPWSGNGATVLSAGTIEAQVRDHAAPSTVSNILTLTILDETILLSSATGTIGGTLSLSGTTTNGPAAGLNYSIDDGATFAPVSTYSGGATWTATAAISLAPGDHMVQVEDSVYPNVKSNVVDLNLVEPETITLLSVGGYIGVNFALTGTSDFGPPASQDVSINGTWSTVGGYETASGTLAAPWSGNGPAITATGTYVVQTRDTAMPSTVSNFLTLVVAYPPETIQLDSATGIFGSGVVLAGTSNNGPPLALDVSLDGGVTWAPAGTYTTAGGTLAAPWSGVGPNLD